MTLGARLPGAGREEGEDAVSWSDAGHGLAVAAGAVVVLATAGSAMRTVVLPRGVPARLSQAVFGVVRAAYRLRLGRSPSYRRRDRVMASYGPVSLLVLLVAWLVAVWFGYVGVMWGLGAGSFLDSFELSGSSLTTLGFVAAGSGARIVASVTEAIMGLVLVALLITYLPSLYTSWSRRERMVTKLEVRAGAPPTGVEMLSRFWALHRLDRLVETWVEWETWFADVEETHTTFPALTYFRSSQPDHSWVTAAGAVLDGAALRAAAVDAPADVDAQLVIRAGYLALRRVAAYFGVPFPADPRPTDPITVTRDEFDEALERLAGAGVPLRADRDRAWQDFAGWRVNYDVVLVRMAALTMAPYAPWSSDRSVADHR